MEFGEGSSLVVRIDDEGEPVHDVARVFEPEDTPRGGTADLNALGIIIGRRLLEIMKGTVTLQNRESGGLRTLIQIPAGQPKAEVRGAGNRSALTNKQARPSRSTNQ